MIERFIVMAALLPGVSAAADRPYPNKALALADVKSFMSGLGADPRGVNPQEFEGFIRAESKKWARVVKESGAKAE